MATDLPVTVVGAGPVGLAAAASLLARDLRPVVVEAGDGPAWVVAQWEHVRLFSPWSDLIAPAAAELLSAVGWQPPAPHIHPTGAEWLEYYLRPLGAVLKTHIRYRTRVVGVARRGLDLLSSADRGKQPFTVHLTSQDGEHLLEASAVIDASGTWGMPNPLGSDGLPAQGENSARDHIAYRIPDLSIAATRARYANKRVAVVGSGHSAQTALIALAELADDYHDTRVVWLRRSSAAVVSDDADSLSGRSALTKHAAGVAHSRRVSVVTGFRVAAVDRASDKRIALKPVDGHETEPFDEVVALTGFRPDHSWLSEVRLDLDPALQAPRRLAPLIDPAVHSCGTVKPHGASELAQPEVGLFVAGMKSYGRAPTFLAITGYEQVRSIAAAIAGDDEAAARVELALPAAISCDAGPSGACGPSGCGPSDAVVQLAGPVGRIPGRD